MSSYTFSKPEPPLPTSTAGYWHAEPIVLSLQTRIKIIVRPPADCGGPGDDTEANCFEEALRQLVADTMLCVESDGYVVVGAVVEQFEDAGG